MISNVLVITISILTKKWGAVDHYDITLDSGKLGIDNTVEMIKQFISLYQNN